MEGKQKKRRKEIKAGAEEKQNRAEGIQNAVSKIFQWLMAGIPPQFLRAARPLDKHYPEAGGYLPAQAISRIQRCRHNSTYF
jgi:hypothetical protein